MDERIKKLSKVLVNHSCRVQKGEKVYIHYVGYETKALARQLIKEVYEVGGIPFPHFTDAQVEETSALYRQPQLWLWKLMDRKCLRWIVISVFVEEIMYLRKRMFLQKS